MVGVIGGSGLYRIDGLEEARRVVIETPWGMPSDEIVTGRLMGLPIAFLPRHGQGHVHSPSSIPHRANIDALKRLGCTDVITFSAVGSLREDLAPGDFVLVDQYIDRTVAREVSFFGTGCVAHVSLADPTCARLGRSLATVVRQSGVTLHEGATYLAMEGPQFSTRAESRLYRSWGADVIGMTGQPEARLAREAELCFAAVAMVTDYDSWHPEQEAVDLPAVLAVMAQNAVNARATVAALPALLQGERMPCPCGCDRALDHAIVTAPEARDPALLARLDAVAGRVL